MPQMMRREEDSLGPMDIPRTCLWGIHTQRAIENFPISNIPLAHPRIHPRLGLGQKGGGTGQFGIGGFGPP